MLTKTSLSAVRALTYLGLYGQGQPLSPRFLAEQLRESPTYLAKVVRHLVRAGILRAHRGAAGGVVLRREPGEITLLAIVEACQGTILENVCRSTDDLAHTCGFHQAGAELHAAIVGVLSRWTLADFLRKPRPGDLLRHQVCCWLEPCPAPSIGGPGAAQVSRPAPKTEEPRPRRRSRARPRTQARS